MPTDRRGFLRLAAGALALLSTGSSARPAAPGAVAVHRATRNTRLGAARERLSRVLGASPEGVQHAAGPTLALPEPAGDTGLRLVEAVRGYTATPGFSGAPLPLAELARLLFLTNGPTGRSARAKRAHDHRAAPSAGALYAGEVYLVAERVRGLPPGVYRYHAPKHALVRLRAAPQLDAVTNALEQPAAVRGAAAAILLTNVFGRYAGRYGDRAYRYALLDTGHIGENLRLAAVAMGLGETASLRFEDARLNALLGVDGRAEAVCAVHAVGRRGASDPELPRRRWVERGRAGDPDAPVPERYHAATALGPGTSGAAAEVRESASGPAPAADATGVALPALDPPPTRSVQTTIERRCSAARFGPRALSAGELGFVLEMAAGHQALARAPGVELLLAVHRVQGLEAGLHRYQAQGNRLVAVRRGDLREALVDACLGQDKAGSAALACFGVGRLAETAARAGERSYRDLLVEAGAVGERIYLAANAARLRARNLAAFWDDDLNALLGLDGRREAVVHLTLVGA